jgi:hypothetical protein
MKTCTYCGRAKFGLVRYYILRRQFCRRTCKEGYLRERAEALRRRKFLAWLSQPP